MKKYASSLMLLAAAAIWGFAFSAQKAAEAVPPFTIGFARSSFAVIFLIFLIMAFDRLGGGKRRLFSREKIIDINRDELIGGAVCGVILTAASYFQQLGINAGTDAGKSAFITALYVVLVPVYGLVLKKRAPLNVWISVAIAAVGFYFLCITGQFTVVLSDAIVLVCALIFPIQILAIDHYSPRCDGVRMSMVQFATVTVLSLVLALIVEGPSSLLLISDYVLPLIFLGVGSSGIAYTLQIVGQKNANPAAASVIMSLESVFGVIGSAIALGERMKTREYIGCAIVFVAVILSQLDLFKKEK